jgi:hypothetical protein
LRHVIKDHDQPVVPRSERGFLTRDRRILPTPPEPEKKEETPAKEEDFKRTDHLMFSNILSDCFHNGNLD